MGNIKTKIVTSQIFTAIRREFTHAYYCCFYIVIVFKILVFSKKVNKIAEMGEPFCRKLSVNENLVRIKNVSEIVHEIALRRKQK